MPTIIESFLMTLGFETSGLKKGEQEAKETLESTGEKAEETGRRMKGGLHEGAEGFDQLIEKGAQFLALLAGGHEAMEFGKQFVEGSAELHKMSKELDLNIEELQGWQRSAALMGGSGEAFTGVLEHLVSTLALIQIHGPRSKMALKLFEGLGIHEDALKGKDAFEVMLMVAEKIQGLPKGLSVGILERMGFDKGTIRLLQEGRAGVEEMIGSQKALGIVSAEQAEQAERAERVWTNLKTQFAAVMGQVVTELLPAFDALGKALAVVSQWAQDHPAQVEAAVLGIAAAMGVLAVAAGIAALSMFEISIPVLLIAAAVGVLTAGVVYLAKEWQAWSSGAESRFSGLFSAITAFWQRWGPMIKQVGAILQEYVLDSVKILADDLAFVFALLSGDTEKIGKAFDDMGKDVLGFSHLIRNAIIFAAAGAVNSLRQLWNAAWQAMADFALSKLDQLQNIAGHGLLGKIVGTALINPQKASVQTYANIQKIGSFAGALGAAPVMHHSERSVHIDKVEVTTQATDAKGIAKDVPQAWNRSSLITAAEGAF